MLNFIKKIFGLPSDEEIAAAKKTAEAPYKIEPPVVNTKSGDLVDVAVNPQITDAVTQEAPAKKPRKPRTPKAEKPANEKAAKPVKAAAMKAKAKRSKKA